MLLRRKPVASVSLLVACYNASQHVGRAIKSALAQTHPRLEVLVAPDDGAHYQELRAWCQSPRVRILPPAADIGTGPGAARNRAIDAADGDFLCVLDADDGLSPNYVEALLKQASRTGAAVAPVRYVTAEGGIVREPPMHPGVLTLPGFAQLSASIRPLIHRSLEIGYSAGFAEDVLHDALVLARTGGSPVVSEAHHDILLHADSLCAKAPEERIREGYDDLIHRITRRPSMVGAQFLTFGERETLATVFRFRAFVSAAYAAQTASGLGYHEFVRGNEASLWDRFRSERG